MKNLNTIIKVKTIKGTSFVGVRNYTNSKDEISNQTFLVGINYANLLSNDLKNIKSISTMRKVVAMFTDNEKAIVKKGYNELVTSLIKRTASEKEKAQLLANNDSTIVRSVAQTEAYVSVSKGLKAKEGALYIYGLCVAKTILKKGVYPTTKKQVKTVIKNQIKKLAELREVKYKQFKLGQTETLKLQGVEI
tara:strand:- start:1031 stop:1606 length:576 start_codon:yes stop_codon:yes gene_type:complete